MKKVLSLLLALAYSFALHAAEPAEVMLIGSFHFKDAGKDVVKVEDFDVFSEQSQEFLQSFTQRLAQFKPTHVLLEYNPENEALMNQRYADYLSGAYELGANEIYQLGFRIAKHAGLNNVHSFDHRKVQWQAEAMFEYAKQHDSPEMKHFNEGIEKYTQEEQQARMSKSLRELLQRHNSIEQDRFNMDLYLATNSIGVGDGYSGADSTASWWHRNFRMYANIQKFAKPGERIIAIGGSGHMAILKNLLEIDSRLKAVNVNDYLENL